MRWKYVVVFLMGLVCLVGNKELFSQHCFEMSYDKNGNRINFRTVNCLKYLRESVVDEETLEETEDRKEDDFLVYPNPNNGKFRIKIRTDEKNESAVMYIYDNKGVLINSEEFVEFVDVDISDNPSGVYLLRIIGSDGIISEMVVKL